jgi:gamma-glutamyltranspeptidase/glutathione hydrolase
VDAVTMNVAKCLIGLAAALNAAAATAVDLSPGRWPAAQRAELQQREFFFPPAFAGPVDGAKILVTGTVSPVAVHAGAEALRHGGSAADAAATVALTQIATDLGSVVSYAGEMQLVYFEAKTGKVSVLDGSWASYADEADPASIPDTDLSGFSGVPPPPGAGVGALGRQTLVPGFMAGVEAMHKRFGRLPFADLFQPAIWFAENGTPVSRSAGYWFPQRQPQFWRTPEGRAFASMPGGGLPKTGDLLRQPALAKTLRAVAAQGAGYMYTGDWGRAYVQAVRAAGGKATLEDMARYRAVWRDPVSVPFAGAEVFGSGENPSACPTLLALNLLSASGAAAMGPYWRDPKALETYVRAIKFAYDKSVVPQPLPPERAAGLGATGCRDWMTPNYTAAVAPQIKKASPAPARGADAPTPHSDAVVVVDRWGNVAALVHTLNTVSWGDTGIVVGGIPISDAAAINKHRLRTVRPGDHVPTEMSPVIALRGGKPVLAIASIGSSLMAETARLAATLLAERSDLPSVLAATPLVTNFTFGTPDETWTQPEFMEAGAYGEDMLGPLRAAGIVVQEIPSARVQTIRGNAVVAVIDQPSGAPHAAEALRVLGFAESDLQAGVPPPKAIALSADVLDRYVGAYQLGPRTVTRIERDGGRLFSRTGPTGVKAELFAQADDGRFFERDYDVQVAFHLDAAGRAEAAAVRRNGAETNARRIDPAEAARIDALPPSPPVLPPAPAPGQAAAGIDATGEWIGSLGGSLRLAFHIARTAEGEYRVTADSPDSGAFDLAATLTVRGETLAIDMPAFGIRYEANWRAADAQWDGRFTQNGASTPLVLRRGTLPPLETVDALDGTWDGLGPGAGGPALLLRFRTRAGHGTSGTLDLPDFNSRNSYLTHIHLAGDRVAMAVETLGGTLEGRLSADGRTIEARFTAFGVTTPVTLRRRPESPPPS